jgi:hypothetical protein
MLAGHGTNLYLFDLITRLPFLGLLKLFVLLVFVPAIIHDPANRRIDVRGDLDEIQPGRLCCFQCLPEGYNPHLIPIGIYQPHLFCPNPSVYINTSGYALHLLNGLWV